MASRRTSAPGALEEQEIERCARTRRTRSGSSGTARSQGPRGPRRQAQAPTASDERKGVEWLQSGDTITAETCARLEIPERRWREIQVSDATGAGPDRPHLRERRRAGFGDQGRLRREDRAPQEGRRAASGRLQDGQGLRGHQAQALSVGDKMAGRHGNKGVISRILPEEDMPYLADGTPVDIVLNPLGVPSRMNIGQILETHLGLGRQWSRPDRRWSTAARSPAKLRDELKRSTRTKIDGARRGLADDDSLAGEERARERHPHRDGRLRRAPTRRRSRRSSAGGTARRGPDDPLRRPHGRALRSDVTVGIIYMLKLHHLADDKIHARSIGPYSLVTQQPLGGKAQFGGQRLGEMEVWAWRPTAPPMRLQEFLTVKSDDVLGRTRIYESIVKGENTSSPDCRELQRARQGAAGPGPERRADRRQDGLDIGATVSTAASGLIKSVAGGLLELTLNLVPRPARHLFKGENDFARSLQSLREAQGSRSPSIRCGSRSPPGEDPGVVLSARSRSRRPSTTGPSSRNGTASSARRSSVPSRTTSATAASTSA